MSVVAVVVIVLVVVVVYDSSRILRFTLASCVVSLPFISLDSAVVSSLLFLFRIVVLHISELGCATSSAAQEEGILIILHHQAELAATTTTSTTMPSIAESVQSAVSYPGSQGKCYSVSSCSNSLQVLTQAAGSGLIADAISQAVSQTMDNPMEAATW